MKNVNLMKCYQKGITFFVLVEDPRTVIRMVNVPPKATHQEAQRPWNETRVKEIAQYVAGKLNISEEKSSKINAIGIIPNCPILNIKSPLKIDKIGCTIELPTTDEEYSAVKGQIEILDGQHRMIAFSPDYLDTSFKNAEKYEMIFVLFQDLTWEQKRELFMICNEKQDKPEPNVLRAIRKALGLLSIEDEIAYELIVKLGSESISPLHGRIVSGGNRVKNGLKMTEITKIFRKSGTLDKIKGLTPDKQFKSLIEYLTAWEETYSGKFSVPPHTMGKISGLRYVMGLWPYIYDIVISKSLTWEKNNLKEILNELYQITDADRLFSPPNNIHFKSETGTWELAKDHGTKLKEHYASKGAFNPFDKI